MPEEIIVPPQYQPPNPEDEDDVVPNEHAAFGIQRATQRQREPEWRDLGLARIMTQGPPREDLKGGVAKRAQAIRTMR